MPAYSFKERFVPFVKDGSKPHTIRDRRKNFAKPGSILYLYFGLRTKFCTKLREEICTDVKTILITIINTTPVVVLFNERLTDEETKTLIERKVLLKKKIHFLSEVEKNKLAWLDGFRPEGCSLNNPEGSFDLMFRYWAKMHELPFIGDILYWNPKI